MTISTRLFALLALILMATSLPAKDVMPALIYDLPQKDIVAIHGFDPATLLSNAEMEELRTASFDGDTFKVLIVLVDWFNRPGTYSVETFDSMMFSRDTWPGGSVADYFAECSYGQLTMIGNSIDWYDAGTYSSSFWFGNLVDDIDPLVDYSEYDGNNDGFVDAILFIRSGNGEEDSGNPDDIWSYAVGYGGGGLPTDDGVNINRWCTVPETWPLRNPINPTQFSGVDTLNRIRVACHELTHNLGMPDLYDYDSKLDTMTYITPNDDNDHPLVDWCVMGYGGYGIMAIGSTTPSHHCGWMKKNLGWNEPVVVSQLTQQLEIFDIETHQENSLFLVPIDLTDGEYFLLEYRNPHHSGMFDKIDSDYSCYLWPDLTYGGDTLDQGLLITHVHDSVTINTGYLNNGTPGNEHYAVMVEDAGYNAAFDYTNNPEGGITDTAQWWYPYETRRAAPFNPDVPGQNVFGPGTTPNSDGYYGPTGITVVVDSIVNERLYATVTYPAEADSDGDNIITAVDNCPDTYNPDQANADGDEFGDLCDNCPNLAGSNQGDADGDGLGDICDECTDTDDDGYGDPGFLANTCPVDNCPEIANPDQADFDGDGFGDVCDAVCCAIRADIDHSGGEEPDIADLIYLVNLMFQDGPPAPCPGETDIDGNGEGPDIVDLIAMVSYMFQGGAEPVECP